jgi:outer membrane protein OmpA-like peptidoglycan-associated protein
VNKGIVANRIETKWYGANDPIATNETEAGRAQNRRTEYILYQK